MVIEFKEEDGRTYYLNPDNIAYLWHGDSRTEVYLVGLESPVVLFDHDGIKARQIKEWLECK